MISHSVIFSFRICWHLILSVIIVFYLLSLWPENQLVATMMYFFLLESETIPTVTCVGLCSSSH